MRKKRMKYAKTEKTMRKMLMSNRKGETLWSFANFKS